ncbi:MAG TPA: hypothetical protein VFD58_15615 [Blastocatellia bacterium]|nr:hypothetical protein [Blastocatellia bacterium]
MFRHLTAFILLFVFVSSVPARDTAGSSNGDYKIESTGALTATSVAEAVRGALQDKGLKVADGGKTLCEIWFRKEIATAKTEVDGANFAQLQDGSLMGVINFPAGASDYRGQAIKAGYYTLRYAVMPVNGAHLGVSPTRDFMLLCPVSDDKDPNVQIKGDALIKLSIAASGSGHVSPWSIVSVTSKDGLPKIVKNEEEHVILEVSLNTKSGALPLGLTIVGKTEG